MSDFRCNPEVGKKCKNNALCHLCDGERLLKLPKPRTQIKTKGPKKKKEGMGFEKRVVKKWNKATGEGTVRRQPNSGAIRALPGDIVSSKELAECKERGTVTSKGEKVFTIHLNWILKIQREARDAGKTHWYVPFGFKGNEEIYVIKDFEHELELLQIIEQQRQRINELEAELNVKREDSAPS